MLESSERRGGEVVVYNTLIPTKAEKLGCTETLYLILHEALLLGGRFSAVRNIAPHLFGELLHCESVDWKLLSMATQWYFKRKHWNLFV